MPGGQAHSTFEFRAYRSTSLSTGSSGTYVQLPLDTPSALVDQEVMSLSGGDIVAGASGILFLSYAIACDGDASLTRLKVKVTRSPGTARDATIAEHLHPGLAIGGSSFTVCAGGIAIDVLDTDTIRIEVASDGVGSLAIATGDAATWASCIVVT